MAAIGAPSLPLKKQSETITLTRLHPLNAPLVLSDYPTVSDEDFKFIQTLQGAVRPIVEGIPSLLTAEKKREMLHRADCLITKLKIRSAPLAQHAIANHLQNLKSFLARVSTAITPLKNFFYTMGAFNWEKNQVVRLDQASDIDDLIRHPLYAWYIAWSIHDKITQSKNCSSEQIQLLRRCIKVIPSEEHRKTILGMILESRTAVPREYFGGSLLSGLDKEFPDVRHLDLSHVSLTLWRHLFIDSTIANKDYFCGPASPYCTSGHQDHDPLFKATITLPAAFYLASPICHELSWNQFEIVKLVDRFQNNMSIKASPCYNAFFKFIGECQCHFKVSARS